MRRYIYLLLLNIICFVLQASVFSHLHLGGVSPNILIMVTAAFGLMYGRKLGMFSGVVGGLLVDAMFNSVIGLTILIYAFIGYINGMLNKLYFKDKLYIPALTIVFSDLAYGILYYVCRFMLRGRMDFPFYLLHVMIPEAIYTLIVGLLVYLIMRRIKTYFNPEEKVSLEEHIEMDREKII
ncbi:MULTISPECIES: rod shape-determining protein MreD [Jutongia]|uniref:Rod shape-determining protein MreD n=1 Tax=Jutongia huaianensis TaxID=2763668 RepID=A0ABR7MZH9_9FIRM|nr:rod shape-determining protein MreD [Jutongia huaianensis]OKZ83974.1 MAG: rod shape-determining protein MreD [Clostridium sp. 44_14]RHU97259.1 rod shape-determining protein MreD [Clostridium sp. OM07-9AC]RHV07371.1 rod shape-determining protein MreD [Clostridium sp. OM07-10AC]CDE70066.1 rod shape-determining protein MreD [Clostridium sp. CAG:277]MBC8561767.1 rod shape-determining protein MreD [Jutongia huaianensis]